MLLRPIENCDRCKMTLQAKDLIIVGDTAGEHETVWWKLCPKCHADIQTKYVIPSLTIDKQTQKVLNLDTNDIKSMLEQHAKIWKQF